MVFRRKHAATDVVSMRAKDIGHEFAEGAAHFKQAAMGAKDVARDALAPTVGSARDAFSPRLGQARDVMEPRVDAAKDAVKPAWDAALASLAPLVAAAVESQQKATKVGRRAEKNTRAARKEAKVRATAAAAALRGQRPKRRWPWVAAALAVGGAAGIAGGLMMRRANRTEWEEYGPESGTYRSRSTADTLKAKAGEAKDRLSDTAHTVKDKVSETADKAKDKLHEAGESAKRSTEAAQGAVSTAAKDAGRPSPSRMPGAPTGTGHNGRQS
jgi:hypothetical protein